MTKNKITLNVLADITKKVNSPVKDIKNENNKSSDEVLIIFTGSNTDFESRLDELKKIKEKGIEFSIAFSFIAEKLLPKEFIINVLSPSEIYSEEDLFRLDEIKNKYIALIGPNITINTATKVSTGSIDSFIPNLIWAFLFEGKPVYLDFYSLKNFRGVSSKNITISNLINTHINTLKSMGVIEIESGQYTNKIEFKNTKNEGSNFLNSYTNINKVITANDLKNMEKDATLVLPKGTILTPGAKDIAGQLGIKIKLEG